jgi:general nucleoside transport system permease protein
MDAILAGTLIASTLRISTPLILCALAGLLSERAGVIDLGLEGKMLFAAFAAAASGVASGSLPVALLTACAVATMLSWIHGYACVTHRGDQVVSGMALNIIAAGLTVVLGIAWFQQGGQTPPVSEAVRVKPLGEGILAQDLFVYVTFALVAGVWWLVYRTRFGLRLRAVGENPHMVEAAGVSVLRLRYAALTLNGILCGLAGAYLVLAQNASFGPNMTAGRGYMALAAMIFGHWRPVPAMLACLLFGFLDTVAVRLQGVALPHVGEIPVQAIQALPYVLTVVLLASFVGRNVAPQALGRPYVKEH